MTKLLLSTALVILAFTYVESSEAQTVKLTSSLDPGEEIVLSAADQKKKDVEFNSRRLLRFHQLWNLYLFRNEEAARTLQSQVDAMIKMETDPAMEAELALAEAENREPREIAVTLTPETSKAAAEIRSKIRVKNSSNETARKDSDTTRLTKVHAGLPLEDVALAIEENSKALTKRLQAEIAAGGENAEKARANLAYLKGTLLPKLRDPRYFGVSKNAFAKEFGKVLGNTGSATSK